MRNHLVFMVTLLALCVVTVFPARAEKLHCPSITDNDDKNTEMARRYFQMGTIFLDKQEYTKAVESFECVIKFVPYSFAARYKLAKSYDALEIYSKAKEQYEIIAAYDTKEAEAIRMEIRKRLEAIKDLKDKVAVTPVEVAPVLACSTETVTAFQEALEKCARLLETKNYAEAKILLDDALRSLDEATAEQRKLCLSTVAGVSLLVHSGIIQFNLNNLQAAQESFEAVFQIRTDANIPAKFMSAKLFEFYQKTLDAYVKKVQEEKDRILQIQQLEQNNLIEPEAEEDPAEPMEHVQPVLTEGKPIVLACRVQDALAVTRVVLMFRVDNGPVQQEVLEKLGKRRFVTLVNIEKLNFATFSYHLVAFNAEGSQVAAGGSAEKMLVFQRKPTVKVVEKPLEPIVVVPPVVKQPVVAPPVERQPAPWFYLAPSAGYEFGLIAKQKETDAHAFSSKDAWGRNFQNYSGELGFFLKHKHRFTLGVRVSQVSVQWTDSYVTNESRTQTDFAGFGRYAYFFTMGTFRPYVGAGVLGGVLRHSLESYDPIVIGDPVKDSASMKGAFLNLLGGFQVCLVPNCHLAMVVEANLLDNVYRTEGGSAMGMDTFKNLAFWFTAGIALMF